VVGAALQGVPRDQVGSARRRRNLPATPHSARIRWSPAWRPR
jgi:hypothetical protein